MHQLYTWNTPNGLKPAILLEELGQDYQLHLVNIGEGEQQKPEYLAINPNGKIPALVNDQATLFESGAILTFLAEQYQAFIPTAPQARADALAWSFWQVGGLGPMMGQWGHFLMADEKIPYAIERYLSETLRLLDLLEARLAAHPFLAGSDYSIADMMNFPWVLGGLHFVAQGAAERSTPRPATARWLAAIAARPAVQRAYQKLDADLTLPTNLEA